MRSRAIRGGLAATVMATMLATGAVTVAMAQDDDDDRRFTLTERATTDLVVDLGAEGDSLGDQLVFGNDLYDEADEAVVGRNQGTCFRTNPGLAWECTWTNILDDGSIVVQGPFYDDLRELVLAVTGGTGAYAGAEGTMTLTALDEAGTLLAFAFQLEDDTDTEAPDETDDPDQTDDPDGGDDDGDGDDDEDGDD